MAADNNGLRLPSLFATLPYNPLSPATSFLASHFLTDWLSRLGLGNQVGSIANHLLLLPTQDTKRSKLDEGRLRL